MIKPMHDKVLVKVIAVVNKTPGGIIIPDQVESPDKSITGEVVAVGTGHRNSSNGTKTPLDVEVGDKVIFNKFAGVEVTVEGLDYLLLEEERILGIIQ